VFNSIFETSKSNTFALFSDALQDEMTSWGDLFRVWYQKSTQEIEAIFRNHLPLNSLFADSGFTSLSEIIQYSMQFSVLPKEVSDLESRLPAKLRSLPHIFGMLQGVMLALEGAEASASAVNIDMSIPRSLWCLNTFRIQRTAEKWRQHAGLKDEVPIQAAILSKK
jgi:hypothetical protein